MSSSPSSRVPKSQVPTPASLCPRPLVPIPLLYTALINHKKSRNRKRWYPGTTLKVNIHIIGLTKCTIYCKKCSFFSLCCYYDHFSHRLKELFQVKNGLTTSLLFFWKMPNNWVSLMTLNGEKKEDGLMPILDRSRTLLPN